VEDVYLTLARRGDVLAAHKYRTLTGRALEEGGEERGDPRYASLLFDDMAAVFEKRLVKDLQYDCPWRMKCLVGE
jgi:predicted TPR repeat methyltransferase